MSKNKVIKIIDEMITETEDDAIDHRLLLPGAPNYERREILKRLKTKIEQELDINQ